MTSLNATDPIFEYVFNFNHQFSDLTDWKKINLRYTNKI